MDANEDTPEDFDVEGHIAKYRKAIDARDAAASDIDRAEYQRIVEVMRRQWKDWQGEDLLDEMTFGELLE